MIRTLLLPLVAFSSGAVAHPGHGGLLGHIHGWDWGNVLLALAAVAVAAVAVWRAK